MNIFVSYTLRDGILDERKLRHLNLALQEKGDAYIDVLHNNSKNPQSYVVHKLHTTDILVACITTGFLFSEWVQFELFTAKNRGIPIVALDLRSKRAQKQVFSEQPLYLLCPSSDLPVAIYSPNPAQSRR